MRHLVGFWVCLLVGSGSAWTADFDQGLHALLSNTCQQCHDDSDPNGEISFENVSQQQLLADPEFVHRILKAIDSGAMPPEGETPLAKEVRIDAITVLKQLIKDSVPSESAGQPLQRLNRFQYNHCVHDLFQLDRDIFALPEKLITRYDDYLFGPQVDRSNRRLPDVVHAASHALSPLPGLAGVKPYPKDLRAEHGYDNQADQLTLSPLLLDAFLRLSVSIVESPDFNQDTVGIWDEYFAPPSDDTDPVLEIRRRLERFLPLAFRRAVDRATLDRYTDYAAAKLNQGLSFTDVMRKVSAAALSSPMFLYRFSDDPQYRLASELSFFLWSSGPDQPLLDLAAQNQLSNPEVLGTTISRMLADPKIERFLDSFPVQWMQLENLMASTPDPKLHPYFYLDRQTPASVQMVLEPLLLFDAVFIENRPLIELVNPSFSYQSDFLQEWYQGQLKPPPIDRAGIVATNSSRDQQRQRLQQQLTEWDAKLAALANPARQRILDRRDASGGSLAIDLQPFAAWEFDGNLREEIRGLDLTAEGEIVFREGMVSLDKSYLISKPLPIDLNAKSLEVRFRLKNLDQRGGGLMGILQGEGFFDTIVIGERQNRHWISGSNGFSRTEDFPGSFEETVSSDVLHLVMVYQADGTTQLYRNGLPYGASYQKGKATFKQEQSSVIFGIRHLPAGGNRYLTVEIDHARLYDRALTAEEVSAAAKGTHYVPRDELVAEMSVPEREQWNHWTKLFDSAQGKLRQVPPNIDLDQAVQQARQQYEQKLRGQLHSRDFRRLEQTDPRYGGIITNSAMLSMTSGPRRTHPVARGVWITEVIFNDPPSPPPNDVPPLNEDAGDERLTIREKFAAHRSNPSCAGCHTKLDPLGFALENFDITGRWRDHYANGRQVDSAGALFRHDSFSSVVEFKAALARQQSRFARSFTEHLLRYAMGRELRPTDVLAVDEILTRCEQDKFAIQSLMREVIQVAMAAQH